MSKMNGSGGAEPTEVVDQEGFPVKIKREKEEVYEESVRRNGARSEVPLALEDSEDPVVHEIPVYLSKGLSGKLFMLQYPVRPCSMSYDTASVLSSRLKPAQQKVELTLGINTACPNYDASKGEQMALNVDGCDASGRKRKTANTGRPDDPDEATFPEDVMDRQVLTSTQAVGDAGRYAVGLLDRNELHLTPLEGVLSLRPSFEYLDKSDKTAKAEGRGRLGEDGNEEDEAEDPAADEPKPVNVRFSRATGDKELNAKRQEKSYEYQQRKAREEPWVPARFHHVKTARWQEESQKMFCKRTGDDVADLNLSSVQYLASLK